MNFSTKWILSVMLFFILGSLFGYIFGRATEERMTKLRYGYKKPDELGCDKSSIKQESWEDFRATGLLLVVNQILHIFGWAIVMDVEPLLDAKGHHIKEEYTVNRVYAARVKFRGFDDKSMTRAYKKISIYMKKNASKLIKEAFE